MNTKILCGVIAILVLVWVGEVLAQSQNKAVNLYKKANIILNSAKSREDYQRAAQKYEEALKIFQRVKSDAWAANCLNQLGVIQDNLDQYHKALEYYEQSLAIYRKIGGVKEEGTSLMGMGFIYHKLGQYTKALDSFETSLAICKKTGNERGEGTDLFGIGLVYNKLGQYTKALDYYRDVPSDMQEDR